MKKIYSFTHFSQEGIDTTTAKPNRKQKLKQSNADNDLHTTSEYKAVNQATNYETSTEHQCINS